MTQQPLCITCKWFDRIDEQQGYCRWFPPESHRVTKKQIMSAFVTTRPGDWCGQHEPRINDAAPVPESN